jgi:hypothetical protein
MPGTVYFRPEFTDQDWKKPDRSAYMAALAEHRPQMATVLDWERDEQLGEVLDWAEEAAQFAAVVIIIPKVQGGVSRLPRRVAGAEIRLGYSVPTRYGGTELPVWEFSGWPVHLLGGSPHAQMRLAQYLDVASADGNYSNLKATRFCEYWQRPRRWVPLRPKQADAPYEAFRRSCENIMAAWRHNDDNTEVHAGR